jgi:hypothetical protein
MTAPAAERLQILADQLRRLSPDRRDPERFHLDKAAIERELRDVAREVSRAERRNLVPISAPGGT